MLRHNGGMRPSGERASELVNHAQVDSGAAELLRDADRATGWMLLVDGTPQSYVDLDDPQYLDFEYVRRLGHLIDLAAEPGEPLRVLHLGGGGLTLARYVTATRPGSSQLAVDADAALVEFVRERLPLDQPPRRSVNRRPAGRRSGSGGRVRPGSRGGSGSGSETPGRCSGSCRAGRSTWCWPTCSAGAARPRT